MTFKKSVLTLLLITALLLLSACSSQSYRDDVKALTLTDAAKQKITVASSYDTYDASFLEFYLSDVVSLVDDSSIVYAVAANDYTEIGVLHVSDPDNLEAVQNAVKAYLDYFKETYAPQAEQYDPSEQKKLKDASYKTYGNYVIYTIMTSEDQQILLPEIEALLK